MITGDPTRRSKKYPVGEGSQGELGERAIEWVCLRYGTGNVGYDDNGTGFPTTDCEAGFNVSNFHLVPLTLSWLTVDSDSGQAS